MKTFRPFSFVSTVFALFLIYATWAHAAATSSPNVLIIITDDMSCDSVGVFGSKLKGITPNMYQLAAQSLRFNHAYVQV